jgi:hypothetical protein
MEIKGKLGGGNGALKKSTRFQIDFIFRLLLCVPFLFSTKVGGSYWSSRANLTKINHCDVII